MISFLLFLCAIVCAIVHLTYKKGWRLSTSLETFTAYILFFTMGLMGVLAAYAHIFMGREIAESIGWEAGSPFQFEMGVANLSYGVLGILAFWIRGRFWDAAILGWSVLLLGCFVGHVISYTTDNNTAPYNIGAPIWFYDLFLPLLLLSLLGWLHLSGHRAKSGVD